MYVFISVRASWFYLLRKLYLNDTLSLPNILGHCFYFSLLFEFGFTSGLFYPHQLSPHLPPLPPPHVFLLLDSSVVLPWTCAESDLNISRHCWKPNVLGFCYVGNFNFSALEMQPGHVWVFGIISELPIWCQETETIVSIFRALEGRVGACAFPDNLYDINYANNLTLPFRFFFSLYNRRGLVLRVTSATFSWCFFISLMASVNILGVVFLFFQWL